MTTLSTAAPSRSGALCAGLLLIVGLGSVPAQERSDAADRPMDLLAVCLIVLAASSTAWYRQAPRTTLVVAAASAALYLWLGYPYGPILISLAVAVYGVARSEALVTAAAGAAGTLALLLAHLFTHPSALPGAVGIVPAAAWVAIPFSLGVARRMVVEANEREVAAAEQRVAAAERLRLAQEVHDVVGHGLAAIQMQADIALHVARREPAQATRALHAISRASGEALDELRVALGTITPPDQQGAPRRPSPGLHLVEDLCARVEDAGVHVDLSLRGRRDALPAAIDLAAYRVLQEALTNVVKHSAHPAADVVITRTADRLALRVTNQSLDPPASGGLGIGGMRRRVEQLGGCFSASHHAATGTFQIHAELPLEG